MRVRPQAWLFLLVATVTLAIAGLACDGAIEEAAESKPDAAPDDDASDARVLGDSGDARNTRQCTPVDDAGGQYGASGPGLLESAVPMGMPCAVGDACKINAIRPFCPGGTNGDLRTYFCTCGAGMWECTSQYVAGGAGPERCPNLPRDASADGAADAGTD